MKQKFAWILILLLALSACAPAPAAESENVVVTEAPVYFELTPTPDAAAAGRPIETRLSAMLPILDSIVRAAGIEGEQGYDPADPAFVWSVLYLAGENFGYTHPLVTNESGAVCVPAKAMEDFALAAFPAASIPDVPAELIDSLGYDAANGVYRLAASDVGETETRVDSFALRADETLSVIAGLYSGDGLLGRFRFLLVGAPEGSAYPFCVQSAELLGTNGTGATWVDPALGAVADISGDGVDEEIRMTTGAEDSLTVAIKSGKNTYEKNFEYFYNPSVFVADVDRSDGYFELFVTGDTGSDDYITVLYRIENGELKEATLDGSVLAIPGDGTLTVNGVVNVLGTWGGECDYRLESGFTLRRVSDFSIEQYVGAWEDRSLATVREGLPVSGALGGERTALPEKSRLLPLVTDAKTYMLFECPDGSLVRTEIAEDTENWGYLIDGAPEGDWFGELMYAG